jgi:hypothetical protein
MNTIVYYLKFFLKNTQNIREYKVLEEEQKRLNIILQDRIDKNKTLFFCFDTVDGLSVCISIKDIQAVQMLLDYGISNISSNNQNFNKDLSLMLRGWNKEFPIEIDNPTEIYDLIFDLDSASDDDNFFLQITDIDGELNLFDINEIVYIEVGTNLFDEGRELSNDE